MLLIDGVKYELWRPPSEDEFEGVVKEHTQEIFGEQSIYLDMKQKLKSVSGIGSIPDGFAIILGNPPQWHIVEVELSSHPLHDHIVSQVSRFISGIKSPTTQKKIVDIIYDEIAKNDLLKLRLNKAIEPVEIYKFLSDLMAKLPILTIIIEKDTEGLREAISTLAYPPIQVVEFQTFRRVEAEAVHAHLFEPLYRVPTAIVTTIPPIEEISTTGKVKRRVTVTLKNLIDANVLKVGQLLYGWHEGKKYEGKILDEGRILLVDTGDIFDWPSGAASKVRGYQEDGWRWWHTIGENGRECKLDELRKEYSRNLSP